LVGDFSPPPSHSIQKPVKSPFSSRSTFCAGAGGRKATNPNNGQKIAYVYDATGTKLRQAVIATNGTVTKTIDYIGGI
jgi:hypothetical protein